MGIPHTIEARVDLASDAGMRLDVFIAEKLGLFSRSQARARIVSVMVNGAAARLARHVRVGDRLVVVYTDPPSSDLVAQEMPLSVLFENDDVVVIDKQQGLVVHPGSGNLSGTLVNGLLFHYRGFTDGFEPGNVRPGIVHRLDKETSGVIIVAKNARAHEYLAGQFRDRSVRKRYVAIVQGTLPAAEGRIEAHLARDPHERKRFRCVTEGGRSAVTRYRTLQSFGAGSSARSFVLLFPRTGRTHQLRVHMRHVGAPIVGDPLYGYRDPLFPDATLMLHARGLRITLPGEREPRQFLAPVPERFRVMLDQLQSSSPSKGL
jgi:23S rRNA pseudouridine1911/1915/1917 synthase